MLVITSENEEDLQWRVVKWQETLERRGFKVNVDETETMVNSKEGNDRLAIHENRGSIINQVGQFTCLNSTISQEGGCKAEVEKRIKAAWGKGREVAEVVCDKKIQIKIKVKLYRIQTRPVLIYGTGTWAQNEKRKQSLKEQR
ncbi:uncharacterized protein [Palaemon carinicauda]|uniref:uncharacterized protein n=1 Tax=Palaemon carinicauda TaxID=392227 RepID=UPI0035B59488